MPVIIIGDPKSNSNDRYAGVSSVKSTGVTAARREAGLIVAPGHTDVPSFVVSFNVAATAALDILGLLGPPNTVGRLRRIVLVNPGSATAAILVDLQLGTAGGGGTGGTVLTPLAVDSGGRVNGVTGGPDTLTGGGSYHAGDTTQATGFTAIYNPLITISVPSAAAAFTPLVIYDARDPLFKPLGIGASGLGPVLVLRTPAIGAGATGFRGFAEFTIDTA